MKLALYGSIFVAALGLMHIVQTIGYGWLSKEKMILPPMKAQTVSGIDRGAEIHTGNASGSSIDEILAEDQSCEYKIEIEKPYFSDENALPPYRAFTAYWNVTNTGNCAITGAGLVFTSGTKMTAENARPLDLEPGETKELSMGLRTPLFSGNYQSVWMMGFYTPEKEFRYLHPHVTVDVNVDGSLPLERLIVVALDEQRLYAFDNGTLKYSYLIRSGLPGYDTPPNKKGEFYEIYLMFEKTDMNGYALGYDYYLKDVPWTMYFFEDYGIHGAPWLIGREHLLGTPGSHGCINMMPQDAYELFQWANMGDKVVVVNDILELAGYLPK
jgi:hypothetical protein